MIIFGLLLFVRFGVLLVGLLGYLFVYCFICFGLCFVVLFEFVGVVLLDLLLVFGLTVDLLLN